MKPATALVVRAGTHTGSRAALLLEYADSLTEPSWQPVPAAAVSTGQNPLPAGTTGAVTVRWPSPATRRFIRVATDKP